VVKPTPKAVRNTNTRQDHLGLPIKIKRPSPTTLLDLPLEWLESINVVLRVLRAFSSLEQATERLLERGPMLTAHLHHAPHIGRDALLPCPGQTPMRPSRSFYTSRRCVANHTNGGGCFSLRKRPGVRACRVPFPEAAGLTPRPHARTAAPRAIRCMGVLDSGGPCLGW
jgi:hypothetical protein